MAKTIAVINQKGGVGKSTCVWALAAGLSIKGKRVLTVDLDAQRNLTFTAGIKESPTTILDVMIGDAKAASAIQETRGGPDIIPADRGLAGADGIITEIGKEYKLKEGLAPITSEYDYIIIDTPPSLGILTVNALAACTCVIIPAQADIFSIQGIQQLVETIGPVRKYCNPGLYIDGILLTRFSPRSILSREVAEMAASLAKEIGTKLYHATIREAVAVKEAQISQQSIYQYAPSANVTKDFEEFVSEVMME